MKKQFVILLSVLFLLFSGRLSAQEGTAAPVMSYPQHEVGISYGMGSNTLFVEIVSDIFAAIFGSGFKQTMSIGPVGAEYFYNISNVVGIGGVATYVRYDSDQYRKEEQQGSRTVRSVSLLPAAKLNWLRKPSWGLYSKVAAGVSLVSFDYMDPSEQADPSPMFNFQLSPVGIEVGKQLRGFAELGWGEQGILFCGLRYRFGL